MHRREGKREAELLDSEVDHEVTDDSRRETFGGQQEERIDGK